MWEEGVVVGRWWVFGCEGSEEEAKRREKARGYCFC